LDVEGKSSADPRGPARICIEEVQVDIEARFMTAPDVITQNVRELQIHPGLALSDSG
jgi:hypothetical protein